MIVTVGFDVYPLPALVIVIPVIVPSALTVAVAVAMSATPVASTFSGGLTATVIAPATYPAPPSTTVIDLQVH